MGIESVSGQVDEEPVFIVSELQPLAVTIDPGATISISAVVENLGRAGEQTIEFRLDGQTLNRQTVQLDNGESSTVVFTVTAPDSEGTYTHTIASADQTASGSLTVEAPEPANFQLSLESGPSEVETGAEITAKVTVENTGEVEGTQTVTFTFDGSEVGSQEVTLGAGASTIQSFTASAPDSAGDYDWEIASDDDSISNTLTVTEPNNNAPISEDSDSEESTTDRNDGETGQAATENDLPTDPIILFGGGITVILGLVQLIRYGSSESEQQDQGKTRPNSAEDSSSNSPSTAQSPKEPTTEPETEQGAQRASQPASTDYPSDVPSIEAETAVLYDLVEQSRDGNIRTYKGNHTAVETPVVIRTLAQDADEQADELFTQTVNGWYNGHTNPNVRTIHDRGTDPRPWVAVEALEEVPTLSNHPSLSSEEIVTLIADVADAIRNIDLYNVSHGGLAPQNIFIIESKTGPKAIVDDWGLRRAVAEAGGDPYITPYTAPEQLSSQTRLEGDAAKTDVYGLGAITYEVLTNQQPVVATEQSILTSEITPPSDIAELPESLDGPLMRALAYDPANRFDSPYKFARSLQDCL